jgi:hypothetical protein
MPYDLDFIELRRIATLDARAHWLAVEWLPNPARARWYGSGRCAREHDRFGRPPGLRAVEAVELLEVNDESLLDLVGLVWTMSWRVT